MEMTIGTGPAPVEMEITPAEYSVELEAKETFIKGDKGDDGYTPIKGIDYFDGKDGYTPVKGVDYFDGVDGQNGRDGQDGYTPRKGIDYFDGQNGKDGKDGKNGSDYVITQSDYEQIASLVPTSPYDDTQVKSDISTLQGYFKSDAVKKVYRTGLGGKDTNDRPFVTINSGLNLYYSDVFRFNESTKELKIDSNPVALAKDILSEDDINALIDAKLGVIENGSY